MPVFFYYCDMVDFEALAALLPGRGEVFGQIGEVVIEEAYDLSEVGKGGLLVGSQVGQLV